MGFNNLMSNLLHSLAASVAVPMQKKSAQDFTAATGTGTGPEKMRSLIKSGHRRHPPNSQEDILISSHYYLVLGGRDYYLFGLLMLATPKPRPELGRMCSGVFPGRHAKILTVEHSL